VLGVVGNMDEPGLAEMLPERRVADVGGMRIGMTHDAGPRRGRHERLTGMFPECDAVVYGHSHVPEVARAGDGWILNPGSPTERRRAPSHTMLEVDTHGGVCRPTLVTLSA
jgi:putative phosphoesterase